MALKVFSAAMRCWRLLTFFYLARVYAVCQLPLGERPRVPWSLQFDNGIAAESEHLLFSGKPLCQSPKF